MATYAYVHNSLATPFISSPSTSNCSHQKADSDCGSSSGIGGMKNQDISDECGSSSSSHALTPLPSEPQRSPQPISNNGSMRNYHQQHQNSGIQMHSTAVGNYAIRPPGLMQSVLTHPPPIGYSTSHQGPTSLISQQSLHGNIQGQMQMSVAGPSQGQTMMAGPHQGQLIMNGIGPGPGPPPTIFTMPPPNLGSQIQTGATSMPWLGPSTSRTSPVTMKMVGDPNMTQLPLPLNVPVGHQVHQFIDELGVLRNIVLSLEPPNSCTPYPQEMNVPQLIGPNPAVAGQMTTYPGAIIQQQIQPLSSNADHLAASGGISIPVSPQLPTTSLGPTMQYSQHQQNQQNSHSFNNTRKWIPKLTMTEEKPAEPENDENARIREMLNRIVAPQIVSVLTTEVEISWHPIDTSEAGISGEAFPQIDASEFAYQATIYENTGRFVASYTLDQSFNENGQVRNRGTSSTVSNKVKVSNLRPNTDYSVQIKATLDDRGVFGEASPHVFFRTAPGCPEAPLMPKLVGKGSDYVTISWRPAANNGAAVNLYYIYVYEDEIEVDDKQVPLRYGTTEAKIVGLKPGTSYRFKIASVNAIGESFEKTPFDVTTKHDGPPRKPAIPTITGVTHRTIRLSWTAMTECHYAVELHDIYKKTFTVVRDRLTGTAVQLSDLSPSSDYKIRVFARNTEGESPRSDWVKVRTQAQRNNHNHHNQNHNQHQDRNQQSQQNMQNHHNGHQNHQILQNQQGSSNHVNHQPHQNLQSLPPQSSHINHSNHQNHQNHQNHSNHQNHQNQQSIQPITQQSLISNHISHQSHTNYVNHNAYAQPPPSLMHPLPNQPMLQTQPIHHNNNNNHSHNMNQNHNQSSNQSTHSNQNSNHHTNKEYPPKTPTNPVFIRYVTKKPEVGWKCFGANAKDNIYHLEGSTLQQPHKFRTIYRGASTTHVIADDDIYYVRVQSISNRGLHSVFTEKIVVPRVEQERAAQKPERMSPPELKLIVRDKIRISWLQVVNRIKPRNVISYELQRLNIESEPVTIFNGSETEFFIDNIPGDTKVVVRIRASVVTSEFTVNGEWSETVSITTPRRLPPSPKNIKMIHEQNELRWECDDMSKDLRFVVLMSTPENGSQTYETKEKVWKIGKLIPGGFYKFVITSIHDEGICQNPEMLEVTIPASVPSQPEAITIDTEGTNKLVVRWTSADSNGSPIINYRLNVFQGDTIIQEAAIVPNEESANEFTISKLEPNTQYKIRMCAENAIGRGRAVAISGRTKPPLPIPPKIECEAEANAMRLRWKSQQPQAPMIYKLVKLLKNDHHQTVYEGENMTSKVKNLLQDTDYTFQIRCVDKSTGTSVWSEPVTFRTALAPPPTINNAPTATEVSTMPGHYVIEWSNVLTVTTSRKQFYRLQVVEANDQAARWHTVYDGVLPSFSLKTTHYNGAILVRVFCIRLDDETEIRGVTSPVTYVSNEPNEEGSLERNKDLNGDNNIPVWRRRLNKSFLPILTLVCFLFLAFSMANWFDLFFNLTKGSYSAIPQTPTPIEHSPPSMPSKIAPTIANVRDV